MKDIIILALQIFKYLLVEYDLLNTSSEKKKQRLEQIRRDNANELAKALYHCNSDAVARLLSDKVFKNR